MRVECRKYQGRENPVRHVDGEAEFLALLHSLRPGQGQQRECGRGWRVVTGCGTVVEVSGSAVTARREGYKGSYADPGGVLSAWLSEATGEEEP